ncbi:MAG: pyruvate formate lyase family protein, partial [Eubacteriales bacterium]
MDVRKARILARLADASLTDAERKTLCSQLNAWEAMKLWHTRYLDLLRERMEAAKDDRVRERYACLYDTLSVVPFSPAKTFREGVQSIWFTFAFLRLCGNWPGIGRMDLMLEELYRADLAAGRITEDDARELLAHFFIKGCEWITLLGRGSGDAQHYQNLVLGGVDEDGIDRTGAVTRLILEVAEEFPISDYPIAVRVGRNAPGWLTEKMAQVIRHGGGVVAMYNEDLVIGSLVGFGYDVREARRFANDGCWEVQIPGRTRFSYCPMDFTACLRGMCCICMTTVWSITRILKRCMRASAKKWTIR